MGDLASEMGRFVNAYSADFGEELDQQRVVIGGVVAAVRRVITKSKATMAVATLEDLQGSVDVVVFPKVFEETGPTWALEQILVVSGRVDHKGEETVLLAESVWTWEQVQALGPEAFARTVADSDRSRSRGRGGWANGRPPGNGGGNGHASGNGASGNGYANGGGHRPPVAVPVEGGSRVAVAAGSTASGAAPVPIVRTVPRVSPLRGVVLEGELTVTIGGPPGAAAQSDGAARNAASRH